MRKSIHFGLCGLLAIVSISAPFAHTHDSGKAEEHLAHEHFSVLHSHISLPSKAAAVKQVDDSARRVNWFHFEHEKHVALAEPAETASPVHALVESKDWAAPLDAEAVPEESPPRLVNPRGPPFLFA